MTNASASGSAHAVRGLEGVVAVQTRLSHVDGENGVLIIGGYRLEELAGSVTFEQTRAPAVDRPPSDAR